MTTKMAAHAESSMSDNSDKNLCYVHFSTVSDDKLTSFTDISWNTALTYAEKWIIYGGEKGKIAEEFYQRIADHAAGSTSRTEQQHDSDQASTSVSTKSQHVQQQPTKPLNAKYHRSCYSKFTDRTKADQAEKNYLKRKATELAKDTTGK